MEAMRLSLSLKILSLFFFWYIPVFALSVAPMLGVILPAWLTPDVRGTVYAWDYELFFVAIFAVWAVFLWKSSYLPSENRTFILFTIWATFFHIVAMLAVGFLRPADLMHLCLDAVALAVPLLLVVWGYVMELKSSAK
jgi:hypothetical protein